MDLPILGIAHRSASFCPRGRKWSGLQIQSWLLPQEDPALSRPAPSSEASPGAQGSRHPWPCRAWLLGCAFPVQSLWEVPHPASVWLGQWACRLPTAPPVPRASEASELGRKKKKHPCPLLSLYAICSHLLVQSKVAQAGSDRREPGTPAPTPF